MQTGEQDAREEGLEIPESAAGERALPSSFAYREQRRLHEALLARDRELADMYVGALVVLGAGGEGGGSPDSFAQAAHSVRELMRLLPRRIRKVPMQAGGERMGDRVGNLRTEWDKAMAQSACHRDGKWSGAIDMPLSRFLTKAGAFFQWLKQERPSHRDAVGEMLRKLDPSGVQVPRSLEEEVLRTWRDLYGFFNRVAKHDVRPPADKFEEELGRLEGTLLKVLRPRTFEDFDEIDRIVEEGERDA